MEQQSQHVVIEKKSNTAAMVSISLAILGFVFSLIPFLGWFLVPVWVLAFLFGIVGVFKKYNRGYAVAGIIISLFTFYYKITFLETLFGL